jgi:hypothetical protein
MLKAAMNDVAQDEIPYIVSAVDSMYTQYPDYAMHLKVQNQIRQST